MFGEKYLKLYLNQSHKLVNVMFENDVYFWSYLNVSGSLAENGVSSSDVADSKPSSDLPDRHVTSDMATVTHEIKQECDSQLASNGQPFQYSSSSSSSSPSPSSSSTQRPSQSTQSGREVATSESPRTVILSRVAHNLLSGEPRNMLNSLSLLPHPDVGWTSPLRPPISKNLQGAEQSTYYRQWTMAKQHHADYQAPLVPHPRRLLLSGPPKVT